MKKCTLLFILLISAGCYAQQGSSRVEQYCEVVVTEIMQSNKVAVDIDYGDERKRMKDNWLKDEKGKSKKFNTVIDALS